MRVSDKQMMYRMLQEGAFGNTIERWFRFEDWFNPFRPAQGLWAIRSMVAGNKDKSGLNFTYEEVCEKYRRWYPSGGGEISPMVDHMLTARLQVHEEPGGLVVWAVEGYRDKGWRLVFDQENGYSRHLYGVQARLILRRYLNQNSLDDLQILLDRYQGHTVELSALDRCFGTVPHRNAVVWEVRDY